MNGWEKNPIHDLIVGATPPGIAALYSLTFPNGKRYLGISTNPRKRLRLHKKYALSGSKFAVHKAIRRFGFEAVRQQILVVGPREFILDMEAKAIAAFQTRKAAYGYNMSAGGQANPMDNPLSRQKMARSLTGRKDSDDVKARKRASWTPERRAAMSKAHKGKTLSAVHRAAFIAAGLTQAAIEKRRAAAIARGAKNKK